MNKQNDEELTFLEHKRGQVLAAIELLKDSDTLNLLTDDEQTELLEAIVEQTAFEEVRKYDFDQHETPQDIAELITFDNTHLLAYNLVHTDTPEVALALFEELSYWKNVGRI